MSHDTKKKQQNNKMIVRPAKNRKLEFKRKALYRHFTTDELPSQMIKLTQSVSNTFAEFSLFTSTVTSKFLEFSWSALESCSGVLECNCIN